MEGGNKFKKRGRGAEEESFPGTPTAKKQVTCHNDTNSIDELSCSQTQELELHNLKVFDFPWLHEEEGMMGESEELFSLEDSFFSSTLNHPTNYCTIAGVQFELSGESETPSVAFPPPQDKWPLEACDDTEGRQIDGSDCIWAPLLNKPLQSTLNYT